MDDPTPEPESSARSKFWQAQRPLAHCEHAYEVFAHEECGALRRCTTCGSLEEE